MDGQIIHGEQVMDPEHRILPTLYFRPKSGVDMAARHYNQVEGRRIGAIGLGAGTIATYAAHGDVLRFYEINPAVVKAAKNYFYYLQDCKADYEIILGDARISLEREFKKTGGHNFHILIVDAFSNDTIPVHLLTKEAFSLYWKHLRPDGILALHISNAYLDLSPVIRNLAQLFGKKALSIKVEPDKLSSSRSEWVLVANDEQFFNDENLKKSSTPWPDNKPQKVIWTDDYSNLLVALKKQPLLFWR
ncbi:MAG: fused MFS/spermidine synthase [Nitrospina sp.]|nr:fused MFS/spermidine synthase [Nitrospina sp.]MBT3415583.1 fused MFS/spermidine synthase [Nitrospina sp.]MBT3855494.1 fused MFS/spermidine synthase [Nitrospina sp.]MBT4104920.1 fused MFS/spermidine synthase [Nitrospina sp.]MBT4388623.1 fused MFS/spermidine synthase [Nitrospina sp.]